jgi:general secretion pathway protein D
MTRARMLVFAGLAGASLPGSRALASPASKLYAMGVKAERAGSVAQAYLYYSEAAAADPRKALYRERAAALGAMAAAAGKMKLPALDAAVTDTPHEIDLRPEAVFDSITARELANERQLLPPPRLEPKPGPQDYALDGDYKALFTQLAARLGVQAVFDNDFVAGHRIAFRLEGASPREALHALEAATSSFLIPLGPKLVLAAPDTDAKRKELEQEETVSVPVPNVLTAQEITEIGQAVKQAVGIEKIFWDGQANEIVMRDRVSRVVAAQSVLQDLISYRSQVVVDLQFIELDKTQMQEFGADLQTSFPISFIGQVLNGTATTGSVTAAASSLLTLAQLAKFSAGQLFGVGIANVNVIAQMSDAGARNLLKTTLVTVENQKATFHSGEKYPVITSQFAGSVSSGGQISSPAPTITFQDLGISVTVTTHVNDGNEVSMDLDTDYKILGAASVNNIPIIDSRKLQSTVRLKSGQWALIAGLTSETSSRTVSGPAFLSHIPLLGHIISHFTGNKAKTYIIIALRPRVMSLPPDQRVTRAVYLGSETRTVTPL